MTPRKKKTSDNFTSIRVLGEKAQTLLHKMRDTGDEEKKKAPLPKSRNVQETAITIKAATIIRATFTIIAVILVAWILLQIRDKIILLLLSFFVASVIDPGVKSMERIGIPRGLGVLLQYAGALILVMFLLFSLTPILATQLIDIARFLSEHVDSFLSNPEVAIPVLPQDINNQLTEMTRLALQSLSINQFTDALQQWGQNLGALAQGSVLFATRVAGSIVGFIANTAIVLALALFIQLEREQLRKWALGFFDTPTRNYIHNKMEAMNIKIGHWARGQVVLGLVVGSLVFIALKILDMPYAATLAVLAGFTEFIPYVGPIIAALPAMLIGVTEGGFVWMIVIAAIYYVIQWCENNLLVPLIMNKAVGLSPIVIIFALLVGFSFPDIMHPILGILLAVPVTTIISLFIEDLRRTPGE